MWNFESVKEIFLELDEKHATAHIFGLNFIHDLLNYVGNSDLAKYIEYVGMTDKQTLETASFQELVSEVYGEFLDSNNYNLSDFMEERDNKEN